MSFQNLIQTLNDFWAKQGCLVGQPYGVEVGAGTGNPHTFFRVLGPEPYNVAYVEPSRRPTDGRYGQSPNRFQHYYQYQVILKPAPKFNQELFIESLIAIGLDPQKHDIRFVEDNWESTPLGAWGLGWEVWCDGMEVAQYTYFQQMAGTPLEVPTLEITYGLERLAMYIQDVDHYKDLRWNNTTTYADIFERHEYWQAKHNFETSTPAALQSLYEIYEKEVQQQLEQKNYWAAYDYQLKVSHIFNLLDARGMVSVSDRVAKFGAMSKAARAISALYLEERESLGFPLKDRVSPISYKPKVHETINAKTKGKYQKNIAIVEIGFEELPATYLIEWSNILTHVWFKDQLKKAGVSYRKAYLYFTPRRIVMKVVQPSKLGRVLQTIKGPTAAMSYDAEGKSTAILEGFLKSKGLKIKDIKIKDENGKRFITAEKEIIRPLSDVFQEIGEAIIASAPKTKWMFWETGIQAFIRPLRWIFAYHNDKRLSLKLMNIESAKTSPLPRYELPAVKKIGSAQQYLSFIREHGIILSQRKRIRRIEKESKRQGEKIGKFSDMVVRNAFLTENPHAHAIELEKKYMELPQELITLILEKNQMYPMTKTESGNIWYHIVANHRRVHKRIAHGNTKVARARLDDGLFYYQVDAQKKLADYSEGLQKIGFHPQAGTYYDKKTRIASLVKQIYEKLGKALPEDVIQALALIKNDKATALGKEFPSLEGVIGKSYAVRDGVSTKVASLLADHYLPTEPGGRIPETEEAKVLSLADKLDSLLKLAEVEKLPEGNHDPFEIRKTVYRLLTLLKDFHGISIVDFIKASKLDSATQKKLKEYIDLRFELQLLEENIPQWLAHNVALGISDDYAMKYAYAKRLSAIVKTEAERSEITDTFKRVLNILNKNPIEVVTVSAQDLLKKPDLDAQEKELVEFIGKRHGILMPEDLKMLSEILHRYFDTVTVIADDKQLRARRLATLELVKSAIQQFFAISFS